MTTIAHLSDLHLGATDPKLVAALAKTLGGRPPSLVVVSGDLTQRARRAQFSAAREFLDQISAPRLVVPGNHDIPLFDLVRRFRAPFSRYQRFISSELDPVYTDADLVVLGLNTARPTTWQTGQVSAQQRDRLKQVFSKDDLRIKILVTHHPLLPFSAQGNRAIDFHSAEETIADCRRQGVEILLSGHFHRANMSGTDLNSVSAGDRLTSILAGTAISRRVRGEANSFNWITIDEENIRLDVLSWDGSGFSVGRTVNFRRGNPRVGCRDLRR
jgi:3',5'-cyclic AMP phosphodiesterase CpdA